MKNRKHHSLRVSIWQNRNCPVVILPPRCKLAMETGRSIQYIESRSARVCGLYLDQMLMNPLELAVRNAVIDLSRRGVFCSRVRCVGSIMRNNEKDVKQQCDTCMFFINREITQMMPSPLQPSKMVPRKIADGICRRYPAYVPHNAVDWCGEYWHPSMREDV